MDCYQNYLEEYEHGLKNYPLWNAEAYRRNTFGKYRSSQNSDVIMVIDSRHSYHRLDGPAFMDGSCARFFKDDLAHREDGPAILWKSGSWTFKQYGEVHRLDGPAQYQQKLNQYDWYVKGIQIRGMEEFCLDNGIDVSNISPEESIILKLKMSEYL